MPRASPIPCVLVVTLISMEDEHKKAIKSCFVKKHIIVEN
jgi:hypothetical protein